MGKDPGEESVDSRILIWMVFFAQRSVRLLDLPIRCSSVQLQKLVQILCAERERQNPEKRHEKPCEEEHGGRSLERSLERPASQGFKSDGMGGKCVVRGLVLLRAQFERQRHGDWVGDDNAWIQ